MHDRIKFYEDRVMVLEKEHETLSRKQAEISRLRLILFLLIVGSIAWVVFSGPLFLLVTLVLTGLFMFQIKKHATVATETTLVANILQLNRDELAFARGDKSVFPQGDIQLASDHIYAIDLDIFGKGSLFQSIDRTGTWEGKGLVIDTLLAPPSQVEEIEQRRAAIKELEQQIDFRQRFHVVGKMSDETPKDMPALRQWSAQEYFFTNRISWIWIARIVSAISVASIGWMIVTGQFFAVPFFLWLVFNGAIRGLFDKQMKIYFATFGNKTRLFQKFGDLFQLVSKQQLTTALARFHYDKVHEAAGAFAELSQLSNRAEQRLNGLVGPLMNGLFLFDVWNIHAIERWRLKYRGRIDEWIVSLANIDMLNSLATYRFNHPAFVDANVQDGPSFIKAKEMGHPLLPYDVSVKNDYELGLSARAHIVTGSNMAGKSTFIRTVGLNVILALNGLPVCAKEFGCTIVSIASCIRITDSLEEHASYFRAELRRLEKIISLLQTGKPYIVLLDEILRGTNSDDKRMGTLAFFRKLNDYNCLAILATHDLVIGKLEEQFPQHYANYCFESQLRGNELGFDYKLRKGVSSSTNATYLMRSLGLID